MNVDNIVKLIESRRDRAGNHLFAIRLNVKYDETFITISSDLFTTMIEDNHSKAVVFMKGDDHRKIRKALKAAIYRKKAEKLERENKNRNALMELFK